MHLGMHLGMLCMVPCTRGLHRTSPSALKATPCCRSTWSCRREAMGDPGMSGLQHFRT